MNTTTTVLAEAAVPMAGTYPVTLALQGGGALGAFGWGVLERLLEERRLQVSVAAGASAGAMNAAMLVQGLATGGPREAQRLLEVFWRRVAVAAGSLDLDIPGWVGPSSIVLGGALRHAALKASSPLRPLGPNPLRSVLDGLLDASVFGREGTPAILVSATRVRTGEARLFRDAEVTAEVLLASACLPQIFPPVEIEGELYWNGGYAANPPLRPLIEAGAPPDILLVQATPTERSEPPRDAAAIRDRAAEIAFGAALRQELRSLAVGRRLLAELPEELPPGSALARLRDARLHWIGDDAALGALPGGSALDTRWSFLRQLRAMGNEVGEAWLRENLDAVGRRATLDLSDFVGPVVEPLAPRAPALAG